MQSLDHLFRDVYLPDLDRARRLTEDGQFEAFASVFVYDLADLCRAVEVGGAGFFDPDHPEGGDHLALCAGGDTGDGDVVVGVGVGVAGVGVGVAGVLVVVVVGVVVAAVKAAE